MPSYQLLSDEYNKVIKNQDKLTQQIVDLINQNAELIKLQNEAKKALEWFIEHDETNDTIDNEFWIEGLEAGRKVVAKLNNEPYIRHNWQIDEPVLQDE